MVNRLDPVNLLDFSGGLNLRRDQFQLAPNESPEMENISIDPLGGIYTRKGWERWNGPDIVDPTVTTWDPRRAFLAQHSDGNNVVYIANGTKVYWALSPIGATFIDLGITIGAQPHLADFATYGDDTYIACGKSNRTVRRHLAAAPVLLTESGAGNWNNDYSNPVRGFAPKAELIEAHAGYMFVANIIEDGTTYPNRIRWSHPTSPEDWAQADFIDISIGGSKITALLSFEDHLLIFKGDSVWALYGYNSDSWQLVQKSSTVGAYSTQSVTRSETAAFFFSASDRGGIYAYGGERAMEISEQLRYALEMLSAPHLVWVGWIARKLWVTLPWTYTGVTDDNSAVFVFDPSVGDGAWTYYTCNSGGLGPIVGGSNTDTMLRPLGVLRATESPSVVRLEALDQAADRVYTVAVLGFTDPLNADPEHQSGFIMTSAGEEIIMSGMPGDEPFDTSYRTPWVTAQWPTRKKSFRRPDLVCRITGQAHDLQVRSYRDYEELNARRQHTITVPAGISSPPSGTVPGTTTATWGRFSWDDGTQWGQAGTPPVTGTSTIRQGSTVRRGSSFGLCRALQLRVTGMTPAAKWGVDAIILKTVLRRFR